MKESAVKKSQSTAIIFIEVENDRLIYELDDKSYSINLGSNVLKWVSEFCLRGGSDISISEAIIKLLLIWHLRNQSNGLEFCLPVKIVRRHMPGPPKIKNKRREIPKMDPIIEPTGPNSRVFLNPVVNNENLEDKFVMTYEELKYISWFDEYR